MESIKSYINHVTAGMHKTLEISAYTVTHAEPLEKVAKITGRILGMAEIAFNGLSKAFANLNSQLRDTILVFETLRFVGVMNMLLTPKNGKYFLSDPNNSWQKRADRVNLAFHTAFKMVKGLNKFGFVDIGFMAKNVVGKLPIFTLSMDSFIIASSFFSTWDILVNSLPRANKTLAKANAKVDEWEWRPTALLLLKANDEIQRLQFEEKYSQKAEKLRAEQADLESKFRLNEDKLQKLASPESTLKKDVQEKTLAECMSEKKKLSQLLGRVNVRIHDTDEKISKIAARDCRGVAADLEKADANFKLKKWEVRKANAQQEKTKIWVRIANAVGKIGVVTLALGLAAASVIAAPIPAFTLLFIGTIVDSIGLTKILIEEFWKPKPLPKAPTLAIV